MIEVSEQLSATRIEAVETAAKRKVLSLAAKFLEAHQINRGHFDHAGPSLPCSCGLAARYVGRRAKRFATVWGS